MRKRNLYINIFDRLWPIILISFSTIICADTLVYLNWRLSGSFFRHWHGNRLFLNISSDIIFFWYSFSSRPGNFFYFLNFGVIFVFNFGFFITLNLLFCFFNLLLLEFVPTFGKCITFRREFLFVFILPFFKELVGERFRELRREAHFISRFCLVEEIGSSL